ncbi:MAG: c-type cytochrome [Bacteroidetes bacterium]|nr:c-type cytochrome [Bacteroidota bacterium]
MQITESIKKKITLAVAAVMGATVAAAQTTAPAASTVESSYNQLAILLVIMTVVLAFVLWGLGQVLVVLSRQLMEKNKNAVKVMVGLLVTVLLLSSNGAIAQSTTGKDAVTVVPNYGGLSATTYYMFVTVIVTEVLAVLFLAFSIRRIYMELMPAKEAGVAAKSGLRIWWDNLDKKIFTKAVPVEKEADVLLDHDYDGIKELDNALPPWWKYGFYFTIGVAVIYLFYFHVFAYGKNPTEEYQAEMDKAKIEKEIYDANNKDKIDENNVPMADATGLAWAKGVFHEPGKCASCHGDNGQGNSGPNLTDDYWIHKGSLNDIYKSVKGGYLDKGMPNWDAVYTPKEISFLASYVKSLHGSNPAGAKPPQGDLYVDNTKAGTDTAKKAGADSATATLPVPAKADTGKAAPKN